MAGFLADRDRLQVALGRKKKESYKVPKAVKDAIKIKLICLQGALPTFMFTSRRPLKFQNASVKKKPRT